MIIEQTYEKMQKMKMNHLAQILREMDENRDMATLSFNERIGLLIDTEWDFRQDHKSRLLSKKAGFIDSNACVEGIDYQPQRSIDKALIYQLSTCDYIKARQDVMILGKTGVGNNVQENNMLTNGPSQQVDTLGRPCLSA
jgi:DNA replication protein DnaC